jgi:hypothetical protein
VRATHLVCLLAAAAALGASCSSSNDNPVPAAFVLADCRGGLTEIARLPMTETPTTLTTSAAFNNLAIDGDTLYLTYAFASTDSGLPPSGGIVAVPVSGGPARVVGAAENTSQWGVSSFWVSGGQVHMQTGTSITSIPADAVTPAPLTFTEDSAYNSAYAHDAEFGYSALRGGDGLTVAKTPIAGGEPTVIATEPWSNQPASLGAMADAGDAVLLNVGPAVTGDPARLWRIPKDGSARSEPRPDVHWSDPVWQPMWLAWDGTDILGPVSVGPQNYLVESRVAPAGTSAPVHLKLTGTVAMRRNDEILSLQMVQIQAPEPSFTLLVATTKGAPAGAVVACGPLTISSSPDAPSGIAATDTDIYVAYREHSDTVLARVTP